MTGCGLPSSLRCLVNENRNRCLLAAECFAVERGFGRPRRGVGDLLTAPVILVFPGVTAR